MIMRTRAAVVLAFGAGKVLAAGPATSEAPAVEQVQGAQWQRKSEQVTASGGEGGASRASLRGTPADRARAGGLLGALLGREMSGGGRARGGRLL